MTAFCTKPMPGEDFHIYGEVFRWDPKAPGHPIFGETWRDEKGFLWRADDFEMLKETIEIDAKYDAMSDEEFECYCEARDARLLELCGNGKKERRSPKTSEDS